MPCEITINNNRTTTSRSCAEKRRENVEEVVRVRWLKRPAVLTRMRRQSAGRKGERESGLSSYQFPSSLRESVPRNVSNATEKYRRIDHFLLLPFSLSLFFPRVVYQSSDSRSPPCLSLLPSARFLPSGWIEDSDQRVRTSSRGRRRGEWGWFRRKVLTPRARSLFKSDFQRDPLS